MASKQPRDLSALIDFKAGKNLQSSQEYAKTKAIERKPATFRIRPEAKKQFGILARELDTTEQDLIAEAMNMIFQKYGKDLIA